LCVGVGDGDGDGDGDGFGDGHCPSSFLITLSPD
jgi:hypothetical protein